MLQVFRVSNSLNFLFNVLGISESEEPNYMKNKYVHRLHV